MIQIRNVNFSYSSDNDVLKDISLDIRDGEFLAIVGHNGSGKSTLAKTINGLILPTSGEVFVNGLHTADEKSILDIRRQVGMVFQNPDNQIVTTVVEEDVAFGPENLGIPQSEIAERVRTALEAVDMLQYARSAPHMLSGGQKQRIAIAGVLAMRPNIIVFDEATAMLDPDGRNEVTGIMKRLNSRGITIIMITQYMEEAAIADRVAVLSNGELKLLDTPREIFKRGDMLRDMRLDVPPVVAIRDMLFAGGMDVSDALTVEELARKIVQCIGTGK